MTYFGSHFGVREDGLLFCLIHEVEIVDTLAEVVAVATPMFVERRVSGFAWLRASGHGV